MALAMQRPILGGFSCVPVNATQALRRYQRFRYNKRCIIQRARKKACVATALDNRLNSLALPQLENYLRELDELTPTAENLDAITMVLTFHDL